MTNKPFDPTKPYCRRDGKPAEIVYSGIDRHVVRSVNIMGKEILYLINHEGIITTNLDHNLDLINIPEKIEGWVNIYKNSGWDNSVGWLYDTKEQADKGKSKDRIACIKVSFTEGEGLE